MSPLGKSGGRSKHHPLGEGAEIRSTQRQRDYIDPVREGGEEGEVPVKNSLEGVWLGLAAVFFTGAYIVLCVLLALTIYGFATNRP